MLVGAPIVTPHLLTSICRTMIGHLISTRHQYGLQGHRIDPITLFSLDLTNIEQR
jgi:hypothetical protein